MKSQCAGLNFRSLPKNNTVFLAFSRARVTHIVRVFILQSFTTLPMC